MTARNRPPLLSLRFMAPLVLIAAVTGFIVGLLGLSTLVAGLSGMVVGAVYGAVR